MTTWLEPKKFLQQGTETPEKITTALIFTGFNPLHGHHFPRLWVVLLGTGLVIAVRNEQGSEFEVSRHLWLLATFGFCHGGLEWIRDQLLHALDQLIMAANEIHHQ